MSSPHSNRVREIACNVLQVMTSDNIGSNRFTFITVQYCRKLMPSIAAMLEEGWDANEEDIFEIICGEQSEAAARMKKWKAYPELDRVLGVIFDAGSVPQK